MNEQLTSQRLISHHRSRPDYEPSPINSLQFAYGDHRYVKFTYELLNQSDILKEKILHEIVEDFSLCNNVDLCLKSSDLISVLYQHLRHENREIRFLSTQSIAKICASPFGRKEIMRKQLIQKLEIMIDDQDRDIRKSATAGLIYFGEFEEGIDVLLDSPKILGHLVDKLIQEKGVDILNNIVRLLKVLMQGQSGTMKALKTEMINRLVNLIEHANENIRYNVCMSLANVSFNEQGKQAIVQKGYIKNVIPKIKDQCSIVRQAACLLLCSLAQLNQGKIQILLQCSFEDIIERLDDQSATVLNAVQLIANLAQHPKGQQLSKPYLDKIDNITCIERAYIDATLEVIKWTP